MRALKTVFQTVPLAVLMLSALTITSQAAVPQLINYQGRLTSAGGAAVPDGNYSVVFTIYDAATSGSIIWTETQSVAASGGLFAVLLGTIIPIVDSVFNSTNRYLGVKVGADPELSPRTRLVSVPYADRVSTVDGAAGGYATVDGLTASGTMAADEIWSYGNNTPVSISASNETYANPTHIAITGIAKNGTFNIGVKGTAYDGTSGSYNSAGIYGLSASSYGGTIWAGYFDGWTNVAGNFYASAKFFKIDDPKRPADRTLVHTCVESDEFKNIYDGVVTTDATGNATITLAEWFDGLNKDFRYQLTVIGQFAQAIVANKIAGNSFSIRTDKPNVEVSWQVTGVRKDPYAIAHPFSVIQDKPAALRGKYLHPIENGVDEKLGVDYAMRQMATKTELQAAERNKVVDTSVSRKQ